MMRRGVVALALILIALPVAAQGALTVERVWGSADFNSSLIPVQWLPQGGAYTALGRDGGTVLYRVNPENGEQTVLFRQADLVTPSGDLLNIEGYEFSRDGGKVLIFTNVERGFRRSTFGDYWVWDLNARRLQQVGRTGGRQQYAKFSPDANLVGFVREHDLYVTDLRTGAETRITQDGSENIINGTTDWVYEEELSLVDAFRISPDNRHIAFWRLDQSAVPTFHLIDETSALYPTLTPIRYPKAGEDNSTVRIGVAEIATGATRWMDLGAEAEIYIAGMDWIDAGAVWMTRFNRHQNRLDILEGTAATGATRVILTETDSAWVEQTDPRWVSNGREFLWESERDGFNQVYRYRRDGTLVRRVSPGAWDVTSIAGVDERGGALYFSGAGEGPLSRQFYRVGLDGRNVRRLTAGPGWHQVSLDPAFRWFVDVHSTAATPPIQTLHRMDGRATRVLADNAVLRARVDSLGMRAPEFMPVPGEDGTPLNAWIIRPPDFDPSRRYPVLLYVYGGPGSQTVMDSWGGQRYLWHQQLARAGYIVASVDNRGTGQRGRAFKKATYLRLGVLEAADQVAAARWFAQQPWVDGARIGIWGWSYGGYLSSLALFTGEGAFRAAIAVAPVTDWRFYDTIYTERFMRTPQENAEGYAAGAPLAHAARLQGRFLLVHGSGDDNVHAQNTTMLAEALQNARRPFDLMVYPNKAHSIAGRDTRIHLYQMFTDWLVENL